MLLLRNPCVKFSFKVP